MRKFNKPRLISCLILSILLNSFWYFKQINTHNRFNNQGVISVVNIKSATKDESTIFERMKFTKVAKIYFVTTEGDTIRDITKNIWTTGIEELESLPFYLPLDSIIYDRKHDKGNKMGKGISK